MAVHLVLGLVLLGVAAVFMLGRRGLGRREASRGRMTMGPSGWTVLALAGLLQVAIAVA